MRTTLMVGCLALAVTASGVGTLHADNKGHSKSEKHHGSHGLTGGSKELHQHMHQGAADMKEMKMSGDVDHDFVMAMKKHHEHGVAMAEVVLRSGKDPKAREFAQRTVDQQKKEIAELDRWLSEHRPNREGMQKASTR